VKGGAYQFASEVDHLIDDLQNRDFHCRIGRSKQLREELLPLSRLALLMKLPGLEVDVEAFEDSGRADGCIRVTGYYEREFEVQVTYAGYEGDQALRAELIASQGYGPGAGHIQRDTKTRKIIATMAALDHDEHIGRLSAAIVEQFRKKSLKTYAKDTVLLIAFDEIKLYGRRAWVNLFGAIAAAGGLTGSQFDAVYVVNCTTNEIHRAE
jgi:hypothetical protein